MLKKLKKSRSSTNFWTNVSTILSAIVYCLLIAFIDNPDLIKETTIVGALGIAIQNAGNMLAHMNKEDK